MLSDSSYLNHLESSLFWLLIDKSLLKTHSSDQETKTRLLILINVRNFLKMGSGDLDSITQGLVNEFSIHASKIKTSISMKLSYILTDIVLGVLLSKAMINQTYGFLTVVT